MTDNTQPEALRLATASNAMADEGVMIHLLSWHEIRNLLRANVAELRRLHAELETLRATLKTYEDLGDAGSDVQLLRTGYAAARLEIESLRKEHADELAVAYMCGASREKELAAQQSGAAYAALPECSAFLLCKGSDVTARAWNVDQMRAFADATCALRAAHGQAPARAAPAAVAGCTRSHPHENMDNACRAKAALAEMRSKAARGAEATAHDLDRFVALLTAKPTTQPSPAALPVEQTWTKLEAIAEVIEELENDGNGWCAKVRWLYNPIPVGEQLYWPQPAPQQAENWEALRHSANEWADMATNGLQWLRNIADGISDPKEALANMESNLVHCRSVNDALEVQHAIRVAPTTQPVPKQEARPVTPYTCPKCHALWLHWPAEQSGFGMDTLNCRSTTHCDYCEKGGVEQLERLERVPAALKAPQQEAQEPVGYTHASWIAEAKRGGGGSFVGRKNAAFDVPIYTAPQPSPAAQGDALTQAARDVLAERQRQISVKGWTPERDDEYRHGELSSAAGCYALYNWPHPTDICPVEWPWDAAWWKPATYRRSLEKAGALILAELERIDRAAQKGGM